MKKQYGKFFVKTINGVIDAYVRSNAYGNTICIASGKIKKIIKENMDSQEMVKVVLNFFS